MTLDFEGVVDAYASTIRRMLSDLDNVQLQELLKEPSKLNDLIANQDQIQLLPELKENKIRLCKWFADLSLSMRPRFEELKVTLNATAAELRHLNIEIQQLKKELDSAAESRRLDVADSVLSVAIRQAEETSENLTDKFVAGQVPIDDFIQRFDDSRKLYHMRKLKAQKLNELLRYQY